MKLGPGVDLQSQNLTNEMTRKYDFLKLSHILQVFNFSADQLISSFLKVS